MALTLRSVKESALSHPEMDGNFTWLRDRLVSSASAPTGANDATQGFEKSWQWWDETDLILWICEDPAVGDPGNAVWVDIRQIVQTPTPQASVRDMLLGVADRFAMAQAILDSMTPRVLHSTNDFGPLTVEPFDETAPAGDAACKFVVELYDDDTPTLILGTTDAPINPHPWGWVTAIRKNAGTAQLTLSPTNMEAADDWSGFPVVGSGVGSHQTVMIRWNPAVSAWNAAKTNLGYTAS